MSDTTEELRIEIERLASDVSYHPFPDTRARMMKQREELISKYFTLTDTLPRDLAQARAELEGVTKQRDWRVKEGIILGNAVLAISNKPHSPEIGDVIQSAVKEIKALQALQRIGEVLPSARSAEGARG